MVAGWDLEPATGASVVSFAQLQPLPGLLVAGRGGRAGARVGGAEEEPGRSLPCPSTSIPPSLSTLLSHVLGGARRGLEVEGRPASDEMEAEGRQRERVGEEI